MPPLRAPARVPEKTALVSYGTCSVPTALASPVPLREPVLRPAVIPQLTPAPGSNLGGCLLKDASRGMDFPSELSEQFHPVAHTVRKVLQGAGGGVGPHPGAPSTGQVLPSISQSVQSSRQRCSCGSLLPELAHCTRKLVGLAFEPWLSDSGDRSHVPMANLPQAASMGGWD